MVRPYRMRYGIVYPHSVVSSFRRGVGFRRDHRKIRPTWLFLIYAHFPFILLIWVSGVPLLDELCPLLVSSYQEQRHTLELLSKFVFVDNIPEAG